jgi:acyl-homoserine lactone acylase PvdQ
MCAMPGSGAEDGIVASANEARLSPDGRVLATLAQPEYRLRRIREVLLGRGDHDIASMQALQCDLQSLQPAALLPALDLPQAWRERLRGWSGRYDEPQAEDFEHIYACARRALAPELGGAWFTHMLAQSELPIWWCAAIDRILAEPMTGARRARFLAELAQDAEPPAELHFKHMLLGAMPGAARGPFPLHGCRATVWQGYRVRVDGAEAAIGPAYRFVTDMGEDAAYTALPGGCDGSLFSSSYASGIGDYLAGRYKRITPPR